MSQPVPVSWRLACLKRTGRGPSLVQSVPCLPSDLVGCAAFRSQIHSQPTNAAQRPRSGTCIRLYCNDSVADDRFDLDLLDDDDPFEIDAQAAHLFKHPRLGIEDIRDVWTSDPMFYPAKPPAHWLMVAEVEGTVLMVPTRPRPRRQPKTLPPHLPRRQTPRRPIPE
jgi:hypothetical protein